LNELIYLKVGNLILLLSLQYFLVAPSILGASMVHNFDPFLWQIHGNFGIRWYGMAYLAGFLCAFYMIHKMALINKAQIPVRLVSDFITYCAIGILVGGRLGYVFFYSPDLLIQFKSEVPFWGVLAVNEGGMASHRGNAWAGGGLLDFFSDS
jgi:prolipoprotein diacylglyceryltransferase